MAATEKKKLQALIAIGELLATGKKRIDAEVMLAFDDPSAYVKKFAKRMTARGIRKPPRNLPWIALIEGLASRGVLVEVDHRAYAEDVKASLDGLKSMPKAKGRWSWMKELDDDDLDDMETVEVLERAGKHLKRHGAVLAQLDMSSDTFPLVLVPSTTASKLVRLGRAAGYGDVDLFTGRDLEAVGKQRPDRESPPPSPKPAEWRWFLGKASGVDGYWAIKVSPRAVDLSEAPLDGPSSTSGRTFDSPAKATAEATRMIAEKTRLGFREVSQDDVLRATAARKQGPIGSA